MKPLAAPRIVHAGPIFSVERYELARPGGAGHEPIVRDIVRHPGAVAVVAVLDDGRLVLIRNHRIAVDAWLCELCAGKLEPGEDPADAARRELEEETGFTAGSIEKIGEFYTSPGFADELMRVYEARGLRPVPRRLQDDERIVVEIRTVAETLEMVDRGAIRDGKTIAGLLLWLRRRVP
ncbi:MAG: NUDIX hydrolase [Phycisphaerales bacterium]